MVEMCEYKFRHGEICKEEALANSKYCILHIDLPEDEKSEEFKRLNKLKEKKVKQKVDKGDFNFEGAKLLKVDFSKMEIEGNASFDKAKIGGYALFDKAKIGGNASFHEAKIGRYAAFYEAKIGGNASFEEAEIGDDTWFDKAEIGGDAWFDKAKIGGYASFDKAKIGGYASFDKAKIGGYAWFGGAEIGRYARFDEAEIKGRLSFRGAIFEKPEAQEESCRKAKRVWEEIGDRIEVDYYFYREMEAKRKQKYLYFSLKELISKLMIKLGLEKLIDNLFRKNMPPTFLDHL